MSHVAFQIAVDTAQATLNRKLTPQHKRLTTREHNERSKLLAETFGSTNLHMSQHINANLNGYTRCDYENFEFFHLHKFADVRIIEMRQRLRIFRIENENFSSGPEAASTSTHVDRQLPRHE